MQYIIPMTMFFVFVFFYNRHPCQIHPAVREDFPTLLVRQLQDCHESCSHISCFSGSRQSWHGLCSSFLSHTHFTVRPQHTRQESICSLVMSNEHKTSTEALKSHKLVVHHSLLVVFVNKTFVHTNTKELHYLPPTSFHVLRLVKRWFDQLNSWFRSKKAKLSNILEKN